MNTTEFIPTATFPATDTVESLLREAIKIINAHHRRTHKSFLGRARTAVGPQKVDGFRLYKDGSGDVFTIEDWQSEGSRQMFTDDDGIGYWAKLGMDGQLLESTISAFSPKPEWATCVTWYNK
jgi:hypothetical protein